MATYTTNFNLEKPAQNEAVDVDVLNSNSDIIDDNLGQARQLALNIGYGYNNAVPYFVGDYCVYQNKLYKCIQNILTPEDFDETKWQQCTLGGELQNIKGNTDDNVTDVLVKLKIGEKVYKICDFANKNLANEYSALSTYEVGDYVIYEDDLYKCIMAVSTAEPFDSNKWNECLVTDELGSGGGGGNADIVHLTQAEYDALPDSKLSDNKVYMLEDVNGDGSQFQPVIYSEDEREIGVWTDGKPLYQKTYTNVSLQNNSDATLETNVSEFEIKDFEIDFIGVSSTVIKLRNCDDSLYVNNNGSLIYWIYASSWYVGLNVANITVRYTKTTDTAGSGTWTPQGVPAVHYSTDEQVIGTWIDGSTVYEKTFSFTPTDNNFYIDVTSLNIDKIINSNGSIFQSYGNVVPLPYGTNSSDFAIAYYDSNNEKLKISEASGQDNYNLNVQWIVTWQYTKSSQGGN